MAESGIGKIFKTLPKTLDDDQEELDRIFIFLVAISAQVEAKRVIVKSKLDALKKKKRLSLDKLGVSVYDVTMDLKIQQHFLDRLGSLLRSIVKLSKSWQKGR